MAVSAAPIAPPTQTWGGTREKPQNVCVGGYGTRGLVGYKGGRH